MRVEVEADAEAAAQRAAAEIVACAAEAIESRGRFLMALSGGSTPARMLELLAEADIDWDRVELWQVDERIAPAGDSARNLTQLETLLLDRLDPVPEFEPIRVERTDLAAAIEDYAESLPPTFDLIHLGLGADGHTASLVPGDPVLQATDEVALTDEYQGHRRITLTYPVLNHARALLYLVTGASKAPALARLLAGDHGIPAGRVNPRRAVVVCDRAAGEDIA